MVVIPQHGEGSQRGLERAQIRRRQGRFFGPAEQVSGEEDEVGLQCFQTRREPPLHQRAGAKVNVGQMGDAKPGKRRRQPVRFHEVAADHQLVRLPPSPPDDRHHDNDETGKPPEQFGSELLCEWDVTPLNSLQRRCQTAARNRSPWLRTFGSHDGLFPRPVGAVAEKRVRKSHGE